MKNTMSIIFCCALMYPFAYSIKAQSRSGRTGQSSNQETTGNKTYSDEEITKIMDKKSYPDYDTDLAVISQIYQFYRPTNNREKRAEQLGKLDVSLKTAEEIGKKYTEYWTVYKQQMKQIEPMQAKWVELVSHKNEKRYFGRRTLIDDFEEQVDKDFKYQGNPIFTVPKKLSDVEDKAKGNNALFDKPDFKSADYQNKEKMANSLWTSVELDMEDIDYTIAYAGYKNGEDNSSVTDLLKKRDETKANVSSYKNDFDSKFVSLCMADLAKVKIPAEVYAGGDKAKFRKAIEEEWRKNFYAQDTIIKIIFNGSKWTLDNRRVYENASSDGSVVTAHNESDSYLDVTVIYRDPKDPPPILNMWNGYIDKDNKDGTYIYHTSPEGGFQPEKILAKNVR